MELIHIAMFVITVVTLCGAAGMTAAELKKNEQEN